MHTTGYESYKGSFQNFYEKVFTSIEGDLILAKKLEELLKKPPFNTGFGMYLYLMRNEVRDVFPNGDQIMKDILSQGLREFDVWKISENLAPDLMNEIENDMAKVADKFKGTYGNFIK